WGRRTITAGTDITNIGYAGQRWTSSSNLSLTLYRAYDPEVGRWISEDPARMRLGLNLSQYVGNNPERYTDPLGLYAGSVGGGVSAGGAYGFIVVMFQASCSFVFDTSGGMGMMCCSGAGYSAGLGASAGLQGVGSGCASCSSICQLTQSQYPD